MKYIYEVKVPHPRIAGLRESFIPPMFVTSVNKLLTSSLARNQGAISYEKKYSYGVKGSEVYTVRLLDENHCTIVLYTLHKIKVNP